MCIRRAVSRAWGALSAKTKLVFMLLVVASASAAYMNVQSAISESLQEQAAAEAEQRIKAQTRERIAKENARRAALTPEQRAAEDAERERIAKEAAAKAKAEQERKQAEAAAAQKAKENERRRQEIVWDLTRKLKALLRDPESVRWHAVASNEDASVICIDYGAMNGFGGITREQVTIYNGNVSKDASVWNRRCTKTTMYDLKSFAPGG